MESEIYKLTPKQKRWLDAYIDSNNPNTFGNATASAKAAGYKGKTDSVFQVMGHENLVKLKLHFHDFYKRGLSCQSAGNTAPILYWEPPCNVAAKQGSANVSEICQARQRYLGAAFLC